MTFSSAREKKLWLWTLSIITAIYATLPIAQPIAGYLKENGVLTPIFILGVLLIGVAMAMQGFYTKPSKANIGLGIGVIAVYLLVFIRMEIPQERSHIVEYSIVGMFVYEAIQERSKYQNLLLPTALASMLLTGGLGILDELIQSLLPNRVFDLRDILFNLLAGLMAISFRTIRHWLAKREAD